MDNKMITHETIKEMKETVDALFMNDLIKSLNAHNDAINTKIEGYKSDLAAQYRELKDRYPRELSKKLEDSEAIKGLVQSTVNQSKQQINSLLDNLFKSKENSCTKTIGEATKNIVSDLKMETSIISQSVDSLPSKVADKLIVSECIRNIIEESITTKTKETENLLDSIVTRLVEGRDKKDNAEITKARNEITSLFSNFQSLITHRVTLVTIIVVVNTLLIFAGLIFRLI